MFESVAPTRSPIARFVLPAMTPFRVAIWRGSLADTSWVRLLSSAQHAQARAVRSSPGEADVTGLPRHEHAAAKDERQTDPDARTESFSETPSQAIDRGKDNLEVEQQRPRLRPGEPQTDHQEHSAEPATEKDHARQRRQLAAGKRRFTSGRRSQHRHPRDRGHFPGTTVPQAPGRG